ncbi:MAG: N-acetylneuraminate synthase family protein [Sulfurimonas sp.]|jgi:sialic acid synthase SpsE
MNNSKIPPIVLPSGRIIGGDSPCFVVAEIGQNHNGSTYTAQRLITAAHAAGVDAVKFCKRDIASDLTKEAYNAPYIGPQSFGETYGKHRDALELSLDQYRLIKDAMRYNEQPEIMFATACDQKSVDDMEEAIAPPLYKIASRDLDNLPLLRYVARLGKPVILSTGMARDDAEIYAALDILRDANCGVVLLVCTSEYPTPNSHVRLWRLDEYRRKFNVLVGLSDHTPGITAGIVAVALGACVVEKHLTLSRAMKGTDHAASLEPEGMARMVAKIREVEEMMSSGNGFVDVTEARAKLGRSLVLVRSIRAGETIGWGDVVLKSPGSGIAHADAAAVVGKVAAVDIPTDVLLSLDHVRDPYDPHCKRSENLTIMQQQQIATHEQKTQ